MTAPVDIAVEARGTLFLFRPQTSAGRQWVAHNVDPGFRRFGEAIAVEQHQIGDLVRGALKAGLVVR